MAFNFSDKITDKAPGNVLIVDSLNLCFRWKHSKRTDFRYEFEQTVQSLARSYDCEQIIITADWGSSSYRKELYPEYKQSRKDKYENQSEEEKQFFLEFFEEYEDTLELMKELGYPTFRFKGVEADDIAAHLVKERDRYGFEKIWLISSDRDWDLLIQENVGRFSYVTRKEVTLETWSDFYSCSPEEYISLKCLTGDAGDNVPGVPGVGPKRAVGLIREFGSALDIYDALPLPGKQKFIASVNEFGDQLPLNYELMDLISYCDDAIGKENLEVIKSRLLKGQEKGESN